MRPGPGFTCAAAASVNPHLRQRSYARRRRGPSSPDAPVSSFTLKLPAGPHSALTGFGNLCARPLIMPTTIVGQNGKTVKQNTRIAVKTLIRVRE